MRVEQDDVGTRDARMHDVAADRDRQSFELAFVSADGERVEQRLRRMLVGAVAGIDHGTINLARQQFHRAGGVMADHENVGVHGIQRDGGIHQRLALADRGRGTDMFMTSAPSRLPASSNEDWVRVEASKNRLTWVRPRSEVRFLSTWRFNSTIFLGEIEEAGDFVGGKALDAQQMPVTEDEGRFRCCSH